MTHPLNPPPQWRMDAWQARVETMGADVPTILLEIAQWGWDQREPEIQAADTELEAFCEWLANETPEPYIKALRAIRRPKPPSLKEQALEALDRMDQFPKLEDRQIIYRALEALSDDQH